MPKIIVTSRYMKSGSHAHIGNYVKYIGTREGVAVPEKNNSITKSQTKLIEKLISDFPQSKELPEYEKYISQPTAQTASDCISAIIDDNMDLLASREIYINYLGTRPNVVKNGSHGLFSESNDPIVLAKAAREVAEHSGTVWTHVVSLRRDDAERMGYTTLPMWRDLVKRHLDDIASAQKIDRKNLKWYAAFHDKENNPHVHIVVYSQNPKEGFLTNSGIEQIRSVFANDIYRDELQNLYQKQTVVRDRLRSESDKLMKTMAQKLQDGTFSSPTLENLIIKLSEQLKTANGKKVYGYLKPNVKQTVDEIVAELAKNSALEKMYAEWCVLEQEKHQTYSSAVKQFPPLAENKVFKPIKNAVINTVINMDLTLNTPDCELREQTVDMPDTVNDEPIEIDDTEPQEEVALQRKYYIKWSNEYKAACNILYKERSPEKAFAIFQAEADKGNILAIHDIGKMYRQGLLGEENTEKADKFIQQDIEQGIALLEKSAVKNENARYYLGKLYLKGEIVAQDIDKAIEYFKSSPKNPYAAYALGKIYLDGIYTNPSFTLAEKYLTQAAEHENKYAMYALATLYLGGEIPLNIPKAIELLERSASLDNNAAAYALGKLYLFGREVEQDTEKAEYWLNVSAAAGNEYAKSLLENMDRYRHSAVQGAAMSLLAAFGRMIAEDYRRNANSQMMQTEHKLKSVIRRKKLALGIKDDRTVHQDMEVQT